jgi:hypothetical protein
MFRKLPGYSLDTRRSVSRPDGSIFASESSPRGNSRDPPAVAQLDLHSRPLLTVTQEMSAACEAPPQGSGWEPGIVKPLEVEQNVAPYHVPQVHLFHACPMDYERRRYAF